MRQNLNISLFANDHKASYVYRVTEANLNGAIHNSFPSVIPTLEPFKLLRQNLNIA
jgi:hypothetical protein